MHQRKEVIQRGIACIIVPNGRRNEAPRSQFLWMCGRSPRASLEWSVLVPCSKAPLLLCNRPFASAASSSLSFMMSPVELQLNA
jgi:hypothetical protein